LNTGTPRSAAASRSTWLVPMQKQPIAVSLGACARTSAVRCVREFVARQRLPVGVDVRVAVVAQHVDGRRMDALEQDDLEFFLRNGQALRGLVHGWMRVAGRLRQAARPGTKRKRESALL